MTIETGSGRGPSRNGAWTATEAVEPRFRRIGAEEYARLQRLAGPELTGQCSCNPACGDHFLSPNAEPILLTPLDVLLEEPGLVPFTAPADRPLVGAAVWELVGEGRRAATTHFTCGWELGDGRVVPGAAALSLVEGPGGDVLLAGEFVVLDPRRLGATRPHLSRRRLEILALLGEGASTDEIAARLAVSRPTVRNHIYLLFRQLGVGSRLEAVATGRRLGLI